MAANSQSQQHRKLQNITALYHSNTRRGAELKPKAMTTKAKQETGASSSLWDWQGRVFFTLLFKSAQSQIGKTESSKQGPGSDDVINMWSYFSRKMLSKKPKYLTFNKSKMINRCPQKEKRL